MLDLAIINGVVFVEGAFRKCDVGIKGETIALVAECGALPEAAQVIDAKGKHVIPGTVDTHVHYRDPGHAERETFYTGTLAAAAGGVTTIFEHPISIPPQYNVEILHNRLNIAKPQCVVDYCFYGAAGGQYPEEIVPLSKEGIVAYKTFLHAAPEGRDEEFAGLTMIDDAEILKGMTEVQKTGLPLASHAENNAMISANIKRLREEGRVDGRAHCESRPPITEIETVEKMLRLAKETGAALELVHISTPEAMELAKQAKRAGQEIYLETCPHYLLLDESYLETFGAYAKCNPALRSKDLVEGLWKYIVDGTVDFIGSDHSPFLVSEKEKGKGDIFTAPAGFPGIDLRLPLMVNEAQKGRVSLERVIELLSVNPAKCFKIFPRKGTISPGADADIVIMDLNTTMVVDWKKSYCHAREIAKVYDGWELKCALDYTISRGRILMENGVVDESAAGWGKYITPDR